MLILVMRSDAKVSEIGAVLQKVEQFGLKPHLTKENGKTIIGAVGESEELLAVDESFLRLPGVESALPTQQPFKLVSHEFKQEQTRIQVGDVEIGGQEIILMAGPCAVESEDQLFKTAEGVKEAGGKILRGGAFKPRTSPYSFQGLGKQGLELMAKARARFGLYLVTEVLTPNEVELVAGYTDILQIGARNMQNFSLLKEVGKSVKPVLLKRGMMSTLEELFMAAEYIAANGNSRIMLCERGIRTFEKYTRNTLDLSAVPLAKKFTHLPVIVDPSHAAGKRDLVPSLSRAAVAAGADGLIIEVHPEPEKALSDGSQSLTIEVFKELVQELKRIAEAVGRKIGD